MPVLDLPLQAWQHEVRRGVRLALWRQAEDRRADMQGVGQGVDKAMSAALLHDRRIDDYKKGVLRSVMAGSVWTQDRLHKAGLEASNVCKFCNEGIIEDTAHLFWECPAWHNIRSAHACPAFAFQSFWPACFR
eukprot:9071202-Karenia_brevis.AAC.1